MHLGTEAIKMQEIKKRVRVLKNGKAASLNDVTGEMIKNRGDWVCNWLRGL